jgi:hypothetical protein
MMPSTRNQAYRLIWIDFAPVASALGSDFADTALFISRVRSLLMMA